MRTRNKMTPAKAKRSKAKFVRMNDGDLNKLLVEIDCWVRGERKGVLTWQVLEDFSGFSRQTLSKNERVVNLYDKAKALQRNEGRKPPKTPDERLARLNGELEHLRRTLDQYDERFARIMYWCNAKAIDLSELIAPMPARHRDSEKYKNKAAKSNQLR